MGALQFLHLEYIEMFFKNGCLEFLHNYSDIW